MRVLAYCWTCKTEHDISNLKIFKNVRMPNSVTDAAGY